MTNVKEMYFSQQLICRYVRYAANKKLRGPSAMLQPQRQTQQSCMTKTSKHTHTLRQATSCGAVTRCYTAVRCTASTSQEKVAVWLKHSSVNLLLHCDKHRDEIE